MSRSDTATRPRSRRALSAVASLVAAVALFAAAAGPASASPGALRILLVEAQCDVLIPAVTLRNELVAEPGVATVDFSNGALATPDVSQLRAYDVVMAMGDCGWLDRVAIGNNLADYQDQGGVVVGTTFTWRGTSGSTVGGRWTDGGYSPYQLGGTDQDATASLGPHDSNSPLLHGVTSLSAYYRDGAALTPGATEIAKWSDGASAVAFKGRAVAIAANVGDYSLSPGKIFSGDFARIFVNAGRAFVPGDLTLPARKATAHGKKLSLPISCALGADCAGGFALDAKTPKNTAGAAKRGRKIHLGDTTLSIPAGQTTAVGLTLTKRVRKLLRRQGKLAATATLTTKPAIVGAADKVTTDPVKIRAARKKKR